MVIYLPLMSDEYHESTPIFKQYKFGTQEELWAKLADLTGQNEKLNELYHFLLPGIANAQASGPTFSLGTVMNLTNLAEEGQLDRETALLFIQQFDQFARAMITDQEVLEQALFVFKNGYQGSLTDFFFPTEFSNN